MSSVASHCFVWVKLHWRVFPVQIDLDVFNAKDLCSAFLTVIEHIWHCMFCTSKIAVWGSAAKVVEVAKSPTAIILKIHDMGFSFIREMKPQSALPAVPA
jgi:hypothetical protein